MQRQSLPTKTASTKLLLTQQTTVFGSVHPKVKHILDSLGVPKETDECLGSRPIHCKASWVLFGIFDKLTCVQTFMARMPDPTFSSTLFSIYADNMRSLQQFPDKPQHNLLASTRSFSVNGNKLVTPTPITDDNPTPSSVCSWCNISIDSELHCIRYPQFNNAQFDCTACLLSREGVCWSTASPYGESVAQPQWTYTQFGDFCTQLNRPTPSAGSPFYGIHDAYGGPLTRTQYTHLCRHISDNKGTVVRGFGLWVHTKSTMWPSLTIPTCIGRDFVLSMRSPMCVCILCIHGAPVHTPGSCAYAPQLRWANKNNQCFQTITRRRRVQIHRLRAVRITGKLIFVSY